jgi:hypothetical protein
VLSVQVYRVAKSEATGLVAQESFNRALSNYHADMRQPPVGHTERDEYFNRYKKKATGKTSGTGETVTMEGLDKKTFIRFMEDWPDPWPKKKSKLLEFPKKMLQWSTKFSTSSSFSAPSKGLSSGSRKGGDTSGYERLPKVD